MTIVYLVTARDDLIWMRRYYSRIFPAGEIQARKHFRLAESILVQNPEIGHSIEVDGLRELVIPRTPFSFIYRLKNNRIEVLRLWDSRADRSTIART